MMARAAIDMRRACTTSPSSVFRSPIPALAVSAGKERGAGPWYPRRRDTAPAGAGPQARDSRLRRLPDDVNPPARGRWIIGRPQPIRRPLQFLAIRPVLASVITVVGLSRRPGMSPPPRSIGCRTSRWPTRRSYASRSRASGARRLRFTTMIVNIGAGPFETGSSRLAGQSVDGRQPADLQHRRRLSGRSTRRPRPSTPATATTTGTSRTSPTTSSLRSPGQGPALRRDAKVGFCFFDTNAYPAVAAARADDAPVLKASGCGKRSSLFVKNGISVGWGDKYALEPRPPVDQHQRPPGGPVLPEGDRRSAQPVPGVRRPVTTASGCASGSFRSQLRRCRSSTAGRAAGCPEQRRSDSAATGLTPWSARSARV